MRRLSLIPVLALFGCSSGGGAAPSERAAESGGIRRAELTNAQTTRGGVAYFVEEDVTVHEVPLAVDEGFAALNQAYATLELAPLMVDSRSKIVGVRSIVLSRRLGGERLGRYFNCGDSQTGPVANQSRITVSLQSSVHAHGEGSIQVRTEMQAQADPLDGTQAERRCSSTRELENRIVDMVMATGGSPGA